MKKIKNKKKRKLKIKKLLLFLLVLFIIVVFIFLALNKNLSNIYISGNNFIKDDQILEVAKLDKNKTILNSFSLTVKSRLMKSIYVKSVKVYKKNFFRDLYIEVKENRPLFYYKDKTVLSNGKTTTDTFIVPIITNEILESIYNKFLDKINLIDDDILQRISEIKYEPNDVDKKRFLLTMSDGNYVYLSIYNFEELNEYTNIIKNFSNKKGILYLDTGNYFKVIE